MKVKAIKVEEYNSRKAKLNGYIEVGQGYTSSISTEKVIYLMKPETEDDRMYIVDMLHLPY